MPLEQVRQPPPALPDFDSRKGLSDSTLAQLLAWDGATFLRRTEGSAIPRIGPARCLRRLAVAAGYALRVQDDAQLQAALAVWSGHASAVVRDHVALALDTLSPSGGG